MEYLGVQVKTASQRSAVVATRMIEPQAAPVPDRETRRPDRTRLGYGVWWLAGPDDVASQIVTWARHDRGKRQGPASSPLST
jgi:hypothetical protein